MHRRKILKQLLVATPTLMLAPNVLASCQPKSLFKDDQGQKAIIIGAGAAGLYAAYLLQQQNMQVQILEASNRYGGRVRTLENFADFPIELGAEEVHGKKSIWFELIKSTGAKFINKGTDDFMMLDGKLLAEQEAGKDTDVKLVRQIIKEIEDTQSATVPDIDAQTYGTQKGVTKRVEHLYNALVGNEHGTSNERISIKGVAEENEIWTARGNDFLLKGDAHLNLLSKVFAPILDKVLLNTQVAKIDYSQNLITLTDQNGVTYTADKVIITVPLTILKKNLIQFSPALPDRKIESFQKIGMDTGMKIILRFKKRFWESYTGSIYGDGLVPEFWSTGTGRSEANNVLTAFVHGKNAEILSAQNAGAVNTVLAELDKMFGAGTATTNLEDSFIMDWGKEPFVQGTYSYPIIGGDGVRKILAEPVADKLFFAGEASNFNGHFGSVHGALETGYRAASEVLASVQK